MGNKRKASTTSNASEPRLDSSLSTIQQAKTAKTVSRKRLRHAPEATTVDRPEIDIGNFAQDNKPEAQQLLPDNDGEVVDVDEKVTTKDIVEASSRPPPVNSTYLPLPWKGRLGYACLNTYLRTANPPIFSSRTCRIASILEHRHPLADPSLPEHTTKNRPDKAQPADVARGQRWVESLGLANARDIIKMLRWNDKYGIKFMRLSSEIFPFASHEVYGYKLTPFAADTLESVGRVVAELKHRVTTHPGQFTQLGSPRKEVVENAIRDLDYHDEMLTLLKLPDQQNRDAVMIIHMGGTFGNKEETLDRFRANYARLSPSVKRRLVLENDDVSWSVHDLLPVCQELNIPLVLDYHHHNIIFDNTKLREGTLDIMELYPIIRETWTRKRITQKMHYSEPTATAITPMQRRKHSPRVANLPPCVNDMDLMIEAKDKEQAVFELMKKFQLPGHDSINQVIPHVRTDEKPIPKALSKKQKKQIADGEMKDQLTSIAVIPDVEIGMGGPGRNVYWPLGHEDWLRPPKRVAKPKVLNQSEKAGHDDVKIEQQQSGSPVQQGKLAKRKSKSKISATQIRGAPEVPTEKGRGRKFAAAEQAANNGTLLKPVEPPRKGRRRAINSSQGPMGENTNGAATNASKGNGNIQAKSQKSRASIEDNHKETEQRRSRRSSRRSRLTSAEADLID